MSVWSWLVIAGLTSVGLTGGMRHYALARGMLDIPVGRSSHTRPTPRGGGVAIVVTFLGSVVVLANLGLVRSTVTAALLGPGALVAVIGCVDDHQPIAIRWRLLVHFAAAGWAVACLGGLPPVDFVGVLVDLNWLGTALAVVYLAWLLNLYNFMDGIDGIAGLQAVTVCCGAATLLALYSPDGQEWLLPACLAMSVLGFLVWNWPPARIFMGDAGSGFLGLMLGVLSIRAAWLGSELWWSWLILLGVFVVDATTTLFWRLKQGQRPGQAHHDHAYQHAVTCIGRHLVVTLAVGGINLFWLLPVAWLVATGRFDGLFGLLIAYTPLVFLAVKLKAGVPSAGS